MMLYTINSTIKNATEYYSYNQSLLIYLLISELAKEVPEKSIPVDLGGGYVPSNALHDFNLEENGPFYYPNCRDVYDMTHSCNATEHSKHKQGDIEERGEQCNDSHELRKRKISLSQADRGVEGSEKVLLESEHDDTDESKTEKASSCSDSNTKRNESINIIHMNGNDSNTRSTIDDNTKAREDHEHTVASTFPHTTPDAAAVPANKDPRTWVQVLTPERSLTEQKKTEKKKKKKNKNKNSHDEVLSPKVKKEKVKINEKRETVRSSSDSKTRARVEISDADGAEREELLSNLGNLPQSLTHQPASKSIITTQLTSTSSNTSPSENRQVSHILKTEKNNRLSARFGDTRTRRKSLNKDKDKVESDVPPEGRTRRSSRHCSEIPVMSPERSCRVASCSIQ